jgi:hypothetical protein
MRVSHQALGKAIGRVDEKRHDGSGWNDLVNQLEPLGPDLRIQRDHPRHVAARTIETGNETKRDRVGSSEEDNRNCPGRCLGSQYRRKPIDRGNAWPDA